MILRHLLSKFKKFVF